MAIPHAKPGEIIDVRPWGTAIRQTPTQTLIKSDHLEVIRLAMVGGKKLPPHTVAGELTVHCLEGHVEFFIGQSKRELRAGSLLYLAGSQEHSLNALEDSTLLVTILLPAKTSTPN